jgi:hypothetical protein
MNTEFSEVVSSIEFVVIGKKINIYEAFKKVQRKIRKKSFFLKILKSFCKSNLAFLIDAFTVDVSYAMYGGFMLEVMKRETVYLTGKK